MKDDVLLRPGYSGRRERRDPLLVSVDAFRIGFGHVQRLSTSGWSWLRSVWVPKMPEEMSYGDYTRMVAKERHCGCCGTCVSCQHIVQDTWRG